MKKILLQVANYQDYKQDYFLKFQEKTKNFALKHNYIYHHFDSKIGDRNYSWQKIVRANQLLQDKYVNDDDIIFCLDADACIFDISNDFPCINNFNYAIDNGNTHCMGIWSMKICDWTKQLLINLLDDQRYEKYKNTELWNTWSEQGSWYTITGLPRHSWTNFMLVNNYGWNSEVGEDTIYSIEELKNNINLLEPIWNTTLLEEDYDTTPAICQQYHIVKSIKEETKIRHFAGQQWRLDYL
jgi:hypothetical protein